MASLGRDDVANGLNYDLKPSTWSPYPSTTLRKPSSERKIDDAFAWAEVRRATCLARKHQMLVNTRKPIAVSILRQYKNDHSHYPVAIFFPSVVDFYRFLPVNEILDLPSDVQADEDSFSEVIPQIPELCRQWRGQIKRKIITLLLQPNPERSRDETIHHLQLACNIVTVVASFPTQVVGVEVKALAKSSPSCLFSILRCFRIAGYYLARNDKLRSIVQRIVKMVNLDPTTTTVAKMGTDGSLFACLLCDYATATSPRHVNKFDSGELPTNYRNIAPCSKHPEVTTPKLNKDFYMPLGAPFEAHKSRIVVVDVSDDTSEELQDAYAHVLDTLGASQLKWEGDADPGVHFDELDEDDFLDEEDSDDSGSDEDSEALSSS
ncbi:hypothetical protein EDD18DRAFT_1433062 [Armillaria luteobubalina]|uniref:Uncharacterized protein n=1 Tax=Armillaria luteobubalina TaxID=153913 RepID=A0AA39PG44_9AGAR|nr:hypothetical protein EDD18DRAFT_1433062 [Armillaria luteobubalina]